MNESYCNVDLDSDPCIFPDCKHFFTMSTMDGTMFMSEHYSVSPEDSSITGILPRSNTPSQNELRTCAICRGSLRSIARYGRIVRRAMLSDAVQRFITQSRAACATLGPALLDERSRLQEADVLNNKSKALVAAGTRHQQMCSIADFGGMRLRQIFALRKRMRMFAQSVERAEQPWQRVADLVQTAKQQRPSTGQFILDESTIQFGAILEAESLLLNCEVAILSDLYASMKATRYSAVSVAINLMPFIEDGARLVIEAQRLVKPKQQVETLSILSQLHSLARLWLVRAQRLAITRQTQTMADGGITATAISPQVMSTEDTKAVDHHAAQAQECVDTATDVMLRNPSAKEMSAALEPAKAMINDRVYYSDVTAEEMRSIYQAMQASFLGTGHVSFQVSPGPFQERSAATVKKATTNDVS